MDRILTIVIWIVVFVVVTGTTQIAIESLLPSDWVKRSSILSLILGWWVAELVRTKRISATTRWVIAIPSGIVAATAMFFFLAFTFSIAHGFDEVSALFAAIDMNEMPVAGTYIILVTRAASAAVLIIATAYVVPASHTRVAFAAGVVVGIISCGLFGYVLWMAAAADFGLTFGNWYRLILELISLLLGSALGIGLGAAVRENDVKT